MKRVLTTNGRRVLKRYFKKKINEPYGSSEFGEAYTVGCVLAGVLIGFLLTINLMT